VLRRTDQPARGRHFQCESPTGSPPAPRASTRTISCLTRGWCRSSGWPDRPGCRNPRREGVDHDSADQVRRANPAPKLSGVIAGMCAGARQHRHSGHAARGRDAHPSADGRCQQLWQQDEPPPATRTCWCPKWCSQPLTAASCPKPGRHDPQMTPKLIDQMFAKL